MLFFGGVWIVKLFMGIVGGANDQRFGIENDMRSGYVIVDMRHECGLVECNFLGWNQRVKSNSSTMEESVDLTENT